MSRIGTLPSTRKKLKKKLEMYYQRGISIKLEKKNLFCWCGTTLSWQRAYLSFRELKRDSLPGLAPHQAPPLPAVSAPALHM
jgi:hypothetical protein